MGGKFEVTKKPKPKVPTAPRKGGVDALPATETGNRAQRRAAAKKKGKGAPASGAPDSPASGASTAAPPSE
jgi:hypothetical protein